MPAHRKPLLQIVNSGQAGQNPSRYHKRTAIAAGGRIGEASEHLTLGERAAWHMFCAEMPGLPERARYKLEIAVRLRARLVGGEEVETKDLNQLNRLGNELMSMSVDAGDADGDDDDEFV